MTTVNHNLTTEHHWAGHCALFAAYLIFGLNMTASKTVLSVESFSPFALHFFRITGGAVLFWAVSLFTVREKVGWRDLGLLFLASIFGVQGNQVLFLVGLSSTSPVDASIISTSVPIITMLFAALFLREPITWKKGAGVLVGASGALLLILTSVNDTARISSVKGDLTVLASGIFFALYLTLFRNLIKRYSSVTLMKWMFTFGVICSAPLCYRFAAGVDYASLTATEWGSLVYVVLFATFIAYLLLPVGQKRLRPTVVSMYNYVQPLVASFVAVVLGFDTLGWTKALSAALIFSGVWLVVRSRAKQG